MIGIEENDKSSAPMNTKHVLCHLKEYSGQEARHMTTGERSGVSLPGVKLFNPWGHGSVLVFLGNGTILTVKIIV